MLDICGEFLPEFRQEADEIYSHDAIAGFLPGEDDNPVFDIDSWARLRQFCATSSQLRYSPTYEEETLVSEAISKATKRFPGQIETEFGRLWTLERVLDISERYPEQLDYDELVGLVAKAAYEGSYNRVRALITHV